MMAEAGIDLKSRLVVAVEPAGKTKREVILNEMDICANRVLYLDIAIDWDIVCYLADVVDQSQ